MIYSGLNDNRITLEAGLSNGIIGKARKRGALSQDNISKILETYTDLNANWLFTGQGKMLNSMGTEIMKKPFSESNAVFINDDTIDDDEIEIVTNSNGNTFFLLPNGRIKLEVVKVPFSSYVSYLDVYQDDIKLGDDFEKITFTVDYVGRGYYVGFKTVGDSMNGGDIDDTPDGAEVLAREIGSHLWNNGFDKTRYGMILITNTGIYHKDIVNYCKETGMLELASRNPKFQTLEFPISEVKQIFNVVKRTF
ncbi:XRE family transcriptional regulator [Flavobacterium sp. NKUCC04_CG]|uniref:XRE family transcriptional regulator n=1 Tax=Flavobacterium sp. NKUCC04_CG TaxID=2842121 RepID=UPI001C5BC3C7|nr:XRE family transcriptional regulator [Flavobacterium sp. NKUCC04_CG]MBW3518322.1 XRE family transcriptional regulator [Flavobacterium sp. NKUCC04_CG]